MSSQSRTKPAGKTAPKNMPKSKTAINKPRTAAPLTPKLDRNLFSYAAAATAAGVGVLALSQASHAEIVYTPTNKTITADASRVYIDLNNDGINDFQFNDTYFTSIFARRGAFPTGNTSRVAGYLGVYGSQTPNRPVANGKGYALALPAGMKVGSPQQFKSGLEEGLMAGCNIVGGGGTFFGPWETGEKNRYLGLKFSIDGETHYGWARLSVQTKRCVFTGLLTGYAYETHADTPIVTGQTSGTDSSANDAAETPPSLGSLALGADGKSAR
jgi:hypothetical protein